MKRGVGAVGILLLVTLSGCVSPLRPYREWGEYCVEMAKRKADPAEGLRCLETAERKAFR